MIVRELRELLKTRGTYDLQMKTGKPTWWDKIRKLQGYRHPCLTFLSACSLSSKHQQSTINYLCSFQLTSCDILALIHHPLLYGKQIKALNLHQSDITF